MSEPDAASGAPTDLIDWVREVSGLPVIVKGIVRGDDAMRAVDHGANAIVVSNHGGRQLDTSIPSITALPDVAFDTWPYTIVATVGLSVRSDYALVVEPAVFQAILDIGADLYQRRSPAATSETTGGGVSSSYVGGMPQRAADLLAPFRMARAL